MRDRFASGLILAVTTVMLMSGCGTERRKEQVVVAPPPRSPAIKPAPATPIDKQRVELGGSTWDPDWDKIVEQALPPEMLGREVPRDVRRFCPRFYSMSTVDKRAFWAYFFQALAGAEAGFEPATRVQHTDPEVAVQDGVTKRTVKQEGLLQLTYEDEKRYGCDFNWPRDKKLPAKDPSKSILQPRNNLVCGVKILRTQIIDRHKPLLSETGYWSTLRPGTMSYAVFEKQMTNVPLACKERRNEGTLVAQK